jgi:hypothetical protein
MQTLVTPLVKCIYEASWLAQQNAGLHDDLSARQASQSSQPAQERVAQQNDHMRDAHQARQRSPSSQRAAQDEAPAGARLGQSTLLPRMSVHTASLGLSIWNEKILMQTSYLATHSAAQQAADQQLAQEETMDAMEKMLDGRQEDVQTRSYFVATAGYSGDTGATGRF